MMLIGTHLVECDFPGCRKNFDLRKVDKPPKGWGTIAITRYGKTEDGQLRAEKIVCPQHTMDFAPRISRIPGLYRTEWRRVTIESPYRGENDIETQRNVRYLREIMRQCLLHGEAPYASHALYTLPGVLDDKKKTERNLGITAGLEWGEAADKVVVYTDLGVSEGMKMGIERAKENGKIVERRRLKHWKG